MDILNKTMTKRGLVKHGLMKHGIFMFITKHVRVIYADGREYIYLLLAEFSVRTVNYGPSFFPSIYGARAINRWKKTRIRNLHYGPKKRG